eukprot:m.30441 g.30441  ORF g.30441 m.30441 type:complete len:470 (-) comp4779_c0_seq2:22-1431(-)
MKVIIVGGGLVGSLQALFMAQRGHEVHVFESREDVRTEPKYSRQSINLALSTRGRAALAAVGLEDEIVKGGIPMHSRSIHAPDGEQYAIKYGTAGQAILAIDRRHLNERLLDAAEKWPGVRLYFKHKLVSADVEHAAATFSTPSGEFSIQGDILFGCDGAHSAVRREIMRRTRMDYRQDYIEHAYKELRIPPSASGEFQLRENYLHIWPRHSFMMIALPNLDRSFTVTLFMPWETFGSITTKEQLLVFFQKYFPDSIPLIGEEALVRDFFENPTSPLIIIKCKPYHAGRSMIMGDAAHAMVPFYGQGMNAGFEDCQFFSEVFDSCTGDVARALSEYSAKRHDDAVAICDLALNNYVEMRHAVTSWQFLLRKKLDNLLHAIWPTRFIPLYTMVTFSRIPYATVIERAKQQDAAIASAVRAIGLAALAVLAYRARGPLSALLGLASRALAPHALPYVTVVGPPGSKLSVFS